MSGKITGYDPKTQDFIDTDLFDVSKHVTQTSGVLEVGVEYTILDFNAGDNFSNVATVISGVINTTGCVFLATGTNPTTYTNGSTLAKYVSQSYTYAELKAGLGVGSKVYKALLSQSGDGTSTQTSGTLTVGKRYAITTFVAGDDFTNVANVVSGVINTSGCEFIATGTTPTDYSNGSTLTDTAAPVATVLVNTLSGTPVWSRASAGEYSLTLASEWTSSKTFVVLSVDGSFAQAGGNFILTSTSVINFYIFDAFALTNADDIMNGTSITIEVYPL